jgi:GTP-binding protein HflX
VEDKLFATLDASARRLILEDIGAVLLIDTVGFIRRLPHALVDAFRSTLEELCLADLLIHVLDASDPDIDRYHETTLGTIRELGAEAIPVITALNKVDKVSDPQVLAALEARYQGIPVSAVQGDVAKLTCRLRESVTFLRTMSTG